MVNILYSIILFLLFASPIVYIFIKKLNSSNGRRAHFQLDEKKKNEIFSLLTNCKTTYVNYINISNNEEYIKYMNNLSCDCKGIGYWGGFCLKKNSMYVGGNNVHDEGLANKLADLFEKKSVVDLGCGLGWYCPIISKKSKKCDQYDGSVNIEEVTNGKVKYLNLAEKINFNCNYDIVMSLEVAEHIPKEFEEVYVNNLVKCSREGILITWSRIGQGGHFHVNNKNREDVMKLFESKGYKYQNEITERLKNSTQVDWLKSNILYFTKSS